MLTSFINGIASLFVVMPVTAVEPIEAAVLTMPPRQGTGRYWLQVGQHMHSSAQKMGQELQSQHPEQVINQVGHV